MGEKINILVFTGNRAEYGLLYPILYNLKLDKTYRVSLMISGSHTTESFGSTLDEIDKSGFESIEIIDIGDFTSFNNINTIKVISKIIESSSAVFNNIKPDIVLVAGDRYETYAVVTSAFYNNIPIAHFFGGDLSQGGHLDDSARHAITKLSHLHFATNEDSYNRIIKLGEEEWRVFNVGSTFVENILRNDYSTPEELKNDLNIDLEKKIILFTQHPLTTEPQKAYGQIKTSLQVLADLGIQSIITYPCNDNGSEEMIKAINEFSNISHFRIVKSLGMKKYLGCMSIASCVAGNSSSALTESIPFGIPCINIGKRQEGRLQSENVLNVEQDYIQIKKAIQTALYDEKFISIARNCHNPYGDGKTSIKIVELIKILMSDKKQSLLKKRMAY